jgi:hypothetical protein
VLWQCFAMRYGCVVGRRELSQALLASIVDLAGRTSLSRKAKELMDSALISFFCLSIKSKLASQAHANACAPKKKANRGPPTPYPRGAKTLLMMTHSSASAKKPWL